MFTMLLKGGNVVKNSIKSCIMFTTALLILVIILTGCGKKGGFTATKINEKGLPITTEVIPENDKIIVKTSTTYDSKEKAIKSKEYLKDNKPELIGDDYSVERTGKRITISYSIPTDGQEPKEVVDALRKNIDNDGYYIKDT